MSGPANAETAAVGQPAAALCGTKTAFPLTQGRKTITMKHEAVMKIRRGPSEPEEEKDAGIFPLTGRLRGRAEEKQPEGQRQQ